MPAHDWTLVEAGIFHAFHTTWVGVIQTSLNEGVLPQGYYALAEQHFGRPIADVLTGRSLAIRHVGGHRLVALVEIVSPANKDRAQYVEEFAAKAADALDVGVHVSVVDLFPPGPHDPHGMHGAILQRFEGADANYDLPAEEPLTLASYVAGPSLEIFVEQLAVAALLPAMPLFLRPDRYVNVPLEPTYMAAYRGMPAFWRDVLEGRPPDGF
jgi:hypothetical protein